jgi:hypothetical protein
VLFYFPLSQLALTGHTVIIPCDCDSELERGCIIDNVRPSSAAVP